MLNSCIIMGRLTADPELRHTNSGVACCSFTLAVERDGKPNEQTGQRAADFIDCTAWRNTAEFICKWFSKGRMAVAAGRMQTRTWKDRHDQSRKSTELQVESMYFADSRKDAAADAPLADDDLPDTWTELSGCHSYKERTRKMEQKIIVLREHTQRTRHRSRKDVRARRRICGVLAALCFLLLLGVVGGMENGTMALGIGTVRVMGTGVAGVLLTWAAGGFRYAARP